MQSCNENVKMLDKLIQDIEVTKLKLMEFYCEEESTFNFDEFLKVFSDLCSNINRVKEVSFGIGKK